jgi:hypothetical protein
MVDRNDLNVTAQVALATVLNLTVSDGSPPVSCIDSITPYWYNSSQYVTVTASGTDDVSGIGKMRLESRYRADNNTPWGDWTSYGTGGSPVYFPPWEWDFQLWDEGIYQLRTIATDYVWNEEEKSYSTYDIELGCDHHAPDTNANLSGTDGENNWYTSSVTVELGATDNLAGVDTIYYKIGPGGYYQEYIEPFVIRSNGKHLVYYYSVDNAGNQEYPINSVWVNIDKTKPSASNIGVSPEIQDYDGHVNISCTVTDSYSGVDSVKLNITDPEGNYTNTTMTHIVATNNYYDNSTYSMNGTYSFYIWAKDEAGNCNTSDTYDFCIGFGIRLYQGWNLISLPFENDYSTGKSLLENITGCVVVYYVGNNSTGIVTGSSPPELDFPIEDGSGYFVAVNDECIFSLSGTPVTDVSVPLYGGWNMIGWFNETNTTAKDLLFYIDDCTVVYYYDAETATPVMVTQSSPPETNYNVTRGMGLFVAVASNSTWDGGTSSGEEDSEGGGGDPPVPYPVEGYAYYGRGGGHLIPAEGANVTLVNNDQQERLFGEVDEYGYYLIDLNDMEWNDNDNLTVYVNGTGEFEGCTGSDNAVADEDVCLLTLDDIVIRPGK